ncbi:TSSK6-activating co-chaperone protein isoform X2 [Mirounga angustirostris]|uniref:TSSK6-activating co-chaperone protein isoform X2 n=2 Tax=Mirounga TaxID=9714 RepID=UPI00313CE37B
MMERGGRGRLRSRAAAPGRVRRAGRRKRGGWGSWPARHRACVSTTRVGAGREAFRVTAQLRSLSWPACRVLRGRDGPFPALAAGGIAARAALGAWSLGPAGWQSPSLPERAPRPPYAGTAPVGVPMEQHASPPSGKGVDHKPKECLGLLECMYANLQLQTRLTQQQMAILENLQASMTQLAPGKGSKNSSLPALSRNLLLNHLPQFSK